MSSVNPADIIRRFPIGRILELSQETRTRIIFLASILDAVPLVQAHLGEAFGERNGLVSPEEITESLDKLLSEHPLDGMLSLSMGNGWNGPEAVIHAHQSSQCIRKIIWSLIYADITEGYGIDRQVWIRLKLSLLEQPPGGGVLVKGYEFTEKELGHTGTVNGRIDVCPDFPPTSFLDLNDDT